MNNKVVTIVFIALCLLLLLSVGGTFWDGSLDLLLHNSGSWKFPKTLFIFWMGMSQAGVLLSAFLLIMKVKIHRRTSLLLELSSLCSLVVAIALAMLCSNSIKIDSGVYSIGIVGFISLLFFVTHLVAADSAEDLALCKELAKIRRPLAWIILPTVFWVVSSFALGFAQFENSVWQGSFFPVNVVACVFYMGLANSIILLSFENYYNRMIGRFLMLCSWFMSLLFLWLILLKGGGSFASFIFACAIPQLLFFEVVRENLWGRLLVVLSILFGILLKCDFVVNHNDYHFFANANFANASLMFAGGTLFVALFFGVRFLLSRFFENDEILMGEESGNSDGEVPDVEEKKYYSPFSAPEFKVVRLPVLCGVLAAVTYGYFSSDWITLAGPFGAYVSCLLVCLQPFVHLGVKRRRGNRK
ncbi:hypothetical protein [Fibrobacter sp. UWB12]|uniref:hypothetical protein n=1 Tax=Fibrobacter sp. UWB12 TaxID=1896203 RepID=UPI000922C242|nr:hypothetical protein [Fibrobacter sp. UWB12]SHK27769.1 hypothetical protein SAMN05720759_101469 [Fibrobacter sp. UWB12]